MKTVTAICHTDECPSNGIPKPGVPAEFEFEGELTPIDSFVCGACGQPITDITEDTPA